MKDYDSILYNILKPLVFDEEGHPLQDAPALYKNTRNTDLNSQEEDFIIYSTGLSNTVRLFGDGVPVLRRCSCDITVSEAGNGNNSEAGYLVNKVEQLLQNNKIAYTKVEVGYVASTDSMQTTFDFYLI